MRLLSLPRKSYRPAVVRRRLIDGRPAWLGRKPLWTTISVLCPLAVLAVWFAAGALPWRQMDGYIGLLAAGLLYVGTLLVSLMGVAFAALGWIRKEPLRYLAVGGLVLNIVTPLWFLLRY